jgi:hypothetical protein
MTKSVPDITARGAKKYRKVTAKWWLEAQNDFHKELTLN